MFHMLRVVDANIFVLFMERLGSRFTGSGKDGLILRKSRDYRGDGFRRRMRGFAASLSSGRLRCGGLLCPALVL